ncbi:MAG: DNA polymerase III subunit beta [Gammaproteobacteria bacterium]|nr:DNA polymerase III subunit beta [Gammaproteobacteria bacterium]MBI5616335.1 DNA polymerase III subunit beta [Gammaproteobacteria bacterium]
MKIVLPREQLLPAIQAVTNVVERRQTLPVLANVLISTEKEVATLTATDMEVELVVELQIPKAADGAITVPARKVFDICRALPPEATISLEVSGNKAKVQSGKSRFTLATLPATEFPSIGAFQPLFEADLDARILLDLIQSTQFAMAHQDVRYYLNGLLFEFNDTGIRTVATDGHRLALCDREIALDTGGQRQIIVPRKGVIEIERLLNHTDGTVKLSVGTNHLKVTAPTQSLTTKLVDGRFPDYERVIPKEGKMHVLADREATKAGLSRTSILSNDKFRGVRLVLTGDTLKASAHNPEQEEAEEEIEVQYNGDDVEIGFNVSYLLDVLGILKSEKVRIELSDANSSCLVKDPDDERARYVIMPMRL